MKSLLCKCKICVFDKFEGSELAYLVISCTFWKAELSKIEMGFNVPYFSAHSEQISQQCDDI